MAKAASYVVEGYRRRAGCLAVSERYPGPSEAAIARRGRAMTGRVDGMVFYRIETSAAGDVWTEIEVLATEGDVPEGIEP
ncbi:hypothetical protein KOAAANKH_00123 [Brevundimonas sp. NIBR10]|nr:hypothetical protein KOAAANKH_00123 [Brevundimonas sp. NIBR10]